MAPLESNPTSWLAFVVSVIALAVSIVGGIVSFRLNARSTAAAERAADEANRANEIALGPAVDWRTRQVGKQTYLLINGGREPASNVKVHQQDSVIARNLPDGAVTIEPGESVELMIMPTWQSGAVHSIEVECSELGLRRVDL